MRLRLASGFLLALAVVSARDGGYAHAIGNRAPRCALGPKAFLLRADEPRTACCDTRAHVRHLDLVAAHAGTWWSRVRGLDIALPVGARALAWSDEAHIIVAKPKYKVGPTKTH